ncbi:hypothetical protein [Marinobacter sp. M-5]|jgi:hypothetical protein|uniref:hypothetical protein n=1 Tax=Marinobacter sp. M-5 TaxID=3081089 RepID=UPI00293C6C7F|nr:hypothetical protein [Marinobacter sp. M-5]MDV3503478.1 hypothetical protein [Marinobacter sp. M-5]
MSGGVAAPEILCQQALEQVLAYLADDGVALTADTCRQALCLVESVLAESAGPDLPARCVGRIYEHFQRPADSIPAANPPLARGHIGYD